MSYLLFGAVRIMAGEKKNILKLTLRENIFALGSTPSSTG